MHFEPVWHAQGLRWIASILESTAEVLESTAHDSMPAHDPERDIEEMRLRQHLRGL